MRKKIIVGNWKMHKTVKEAEAFAKAFYPFALEVSNKSVIVGVAPAYLSLDVVKKNAPKMLVVAQNCHYEPKGAFTSDVSIPMLQELNIDGSLIGHSERRKYQHESNQDCNKKLHALFSNKMLPIYCVGETLEEYEAGKSKEVVEKQLKEGLEGIGGRNVKQLVIAYEPVWSIGTGKNASKEIAQDMCKFIRELICKLYDQDVASEVLIQYGGSVKPENVKEYLACPDIDGVLVGGASLEVEGFKELINNALD